MKKKVALVLTCFVVCMVGILSGCVSNKTYYYTPTNKKVANDADIFYRNAGTDNNGAAKNDELVQRLIDVKPSQRQLDFAEIEYYNFIHYGMNTYTGNEWGEGNDPVSMFNPTTIDTDQWCEALKASGSKGIIFTAKHHDGFCLWDSAYTDYDVMSSPYGKDVVKQLSESCAKYDLKFGVYLSPWDRHDPSYGTDAYHDYFTNQLTELLTNYGDIFSVWFDGAGGKEGWSYDWERYYNLVRALQPNAVMCVSGPDVRWVGNEAGVSRPSEWSVVSASNEANPGFQMTPEDAERLQNLTYDSKDTGSRELLKLFKDLKWYPAEVDVSIRKGWFYHEDQKPKDLDHLLNIFYKSVGGNSSLLLNVPPNKEGRIDDKDVARLKELGEAVAKSTANKIEPKTITVGNSPLNLRTEEGLWNINNSDRETNFIMGKNDGILQFDFDGLKNVKRIDIREDQRYSQRIEFFDVWGRNKKGKWVLINKNTNVGNRRTLVLNPKSNTMYDSIRIVIKQSRSSAVLRSVEFFAA